MPSRRVGRGVPVRVMFGVAGVVRPCRSRPDTAAAAAVRRARTRRGGHGTARGSPRAHRRTWPSSGGGVGLLPRSGPADAPVPPWPAAGSRHTRRHRSGDGLGRAGRGAGRADTGGGAAGMHFRWARGSRRLPLATAGRGTAGAYASSIGRGYASSRASSPRAWVRSAGMPTGPRTWSPRNHRGRGGRVVHRSTCGSSSCPVAPNRGRGVSSRHRAALLVRAGGRGRGARHAPVPATGTTACRPSAVRSYFARTPRASRAARI